MVTSRQLDRLATSPKEYIRFATTGRLPRMLKPSSPLIDLLEQLDPRDRMRIVGVTVGPTVGYTGSRKFQNAEQVLNWVLPRSEMVEGESWPAESWRDKRFSGSLTLTVLLGSATSFPQDILQRYVRLK